MFLIIAGGLIVDIEDRLAIVGGTFDGVFAVVVMRAQCMASEDEFGLRGVIVAS